MNLRKTLALSLLALALPATMAQAYVINNYWKDGSNIVMDDVMSGNWSTQAQFQMSEWNEVDTTDNSHAFRINSSPQFSFGANDGDNTIGFLGESGLNSEYGLSYSNALAWAVCRTPWYSSRYDECDVMIDPTLSWQTAPDNNNWFQSTVLHELGHVRGLGHYNQTLSMQNSGTSKYLRADTLYMDDKVGVRQNATTVSERDIVIYNKFHTGSSPQWMTMSPTVLREGDTIQLNNITVQNRGSQAFNGSLRFGVYLSTNNFISTADQLLNTGSWSSFGTFTNSTFNWSATIPTVNDCGTRFIGGIIDDNSAWSERFENNNSVAFTNGVPYSGTTYSPTPLTIRLREDIYEPNDSLFAARSISVPFYRSGLSIDTDFENDYYVFTVSQTGQLTASTIFTHSTGNINMYLKNSAGSIIATATTSTNNETITYNSLSPGTYYLQVLGSGTGSCNRYTLDIDFTP